jgi:ribosome biogenesis GTPase
MNEFEANIVESFGRHVLIENTAFERKPAVLFGKRLQVVCGDKVKVRGSPQTAELQVVASLPRRSLFSRTDTRGRSEPLAANLTLVAAMMSAEPPCDPYIIDRYLAGATYAGVRGMIIVNKADLQIEGEFKDSVADFVRAGFPLLQVSAVQGTGLQELRSVLAKEVTLLVGQSGVGKSTLTNILVPESARPTQTLSVASGEGRHTTVSAALYHMPSGGDLIDSPGVRDYAPAPTSEAQVQVGWPEIMRFASQCKFNDCTHLREPACAVQAAVATNEISARRYESYKRLMNLMRQLMPSWQRPR